MSWVAVGVGISAVSTGYSIYNSSKQNAAAEDAASAQRSMLDGADGRAIFGSVPEAAMFETKPYVPINYGQVQLNTVNDNLTALPKINDLTAQLNQSLRADSGLRIEQFAPGFQANLKTLTNAAGSLVNGQLPYSDVMDIVANRGELAGSLGTPGTATNATLKDLGLSRLSAMQSGADMMTRIGNLVEQIDPISQRSRAVDWTLNPSQTVPLAQADAQFGASYDQMERSLVQQSEQNANNLAAMADPAAAGMFGAQMQLAGGAPYGGGGANIGGQVLNGLGSALNAYRSISAGNQQSAAANNRFAPEPSTSAYNTWGPTTPANNYYGWMETRRAQPV